MFDPPPATPGPGQQLRPPRRQVRLSDEHSPTRSRTNDDLLVRLSPVTAVDILQSPTTELKQCLDNYTVSEQDFAMRAAVASQKIYEWLQELSDWPWPAASGSAGFEMPDPKRRKLMAADEDPATESDYFGSLPAKDVTRYEERVDGISRDMDDLRIEDIKSHVMHSHIIPLSRPGTPVSDARALGSMLSYNRMDDLTALLTAIIIQALPNLSKLYRLLRIWQVRLSVLRRVPALLAGIAEAEFALQSAWDVLSSPANRPPVEDGGENDELASLEKAYSVVKGVLEKQIAKSGHSLDYMLDSLEGLQDTLPDGWLDRMEAIERDYSEWVTAGERKIREGEWAKVSRQRQSILPSADATSPNALPAAVGGSTTVTLPVPVMIVTPRNSLVESEDSAIVFHADTTPEHSDGSDGDGTLEVSPSHLQAQKKAQPGTGLDGSNDVAKAKRSPLAEVRNGEGTRKTPLTLDRPKKPVASGTRPHSRENHTDASSRADSVDANAPQTPESEGELDLPPLIRPERRGSVGSESSTIIHGHTSLLADATSDMPEISASPPLPRHKLAQISPKKPAAERFMSISPPSSPPFRPGQRDGSVSPMVGPRGDGLLPALPLESSFVEEDFDQSFTSVRPPGPTDKSDEHLRQQISDILDSIPANIKLGAAPSKVNLNPPPPDLPGRKLRKSSKEPIRRSASSLSMASRASSRAPTPYLTLAPAYAKNPRPRRTGGGSDIKVYHLSRSTGEAPIKLFIRCVGENGERVMVRVGGGWADLGEYLKEYAAHHGRRSTGKMDKAKVEIRDLPRSQSRGPASSPPSRPASAMDMSPMTPLSVRKARKSFGAADLPSTSLLLPQTPAVPPIPDKYTPSSEDSSRSRSSSHAWAEDDSSFLGLAGPTGRRVEMSEENRAWVESVKEKVRLASGELRKPSDFGDMGKVGGTKRLFRKSGI
ncbi:hypothetical protein Cob_v007832 [Colletotrichum orbiculare MAFF 240422]|uniref:Uncharacterized protein n=1 Tax=Colletotrichum orbiculare (strain 104-T / ATCC 96160 / CBS 514.97 / LARS 414 / MAFF 240422) TaxID=1213857 RepID=N4VJW0_COLOR|nr:hypothetical protein Cob_v007832 [Colletotrichum orbiculare MAFF 240422]